jgi:prophage regulatory protein
LVHDTVEDASGMDAPFLKVEKGFANVGAHRSGARGIRAPSFFIRSLPLASPRGLRYIRLREVCARVGLKQSTVYRLIALSRFPKQIKLSEHASAWIEGEIEDFMIARISERDHQSLEQAPPPESPSRRG